MTPAEAAAPEQSGVDPVFAVLLVVPVIVASTEPDSIKIEVAAIVITSDLVISVLHFFANRRHKLMSNKSRH